MTFLAFTLGFAIAATAAVLVALDLRKWMESEIERSRSERDYFAGLVAEYEHDESLPEPEEVECKPVTIQ